jgi:hypothetical protein
VERNSRDSGGMEGYEWDDWGGVGGGGLKVNWGGERMGGVDGCTLQAFPASQKQDKLHVLSSGLWLWEITLAPG